MTDLSPEQVANALQLAWDDFVSDTGEYPGCFEVRGDRLYADFTVSNFATHVANWLNQARAHNLLRGEGERDCLALGFLDSDEPVRCGWAVGHVGACSWDHVAESADADAILDPLTPEETT